MKKILLAFYLTSITIILSGQGPQPILPPEFSDCDCDVYVYIPRGPHNIPTHTIGNLDRFETVIDGVCERTVEVVYRKRFVNQCNSVNEVLERFKDEKRICFSGTFGVESTIFMRGGQTIRMVENTIFSYNSDGVDPAISMIGNYNTLDGGGDGKIYSRQPNEQGLIVINSQGNTGSINDPNDPNYNISGNANYNQIKNITLSSILVNGNVGLEAHENRAVVMTNTPESIVTKSPGTDRGSNYFSNLKNVKFTAFSTAIHFRGWSNANNISDVEMKYISHYGIWLTGCVDNSFTNIRFKYCGDATAIRLDNYLISTEGLTELNGYPMAPDPQNHPRVEYTAVGQISNVLMGNGASQQQFNDYFLEGTNPSSRNLAEIYKYTALEAHCNMENIIGGDGLIDRYGLLGLEETYNNIPVSISMSITDFNPSLPDYGILNLFDPIQDNNGETLEAICTTESRYTRSYIRPQANAFSDISVYDENGAPQVSIVVAVHDSEDDAPKCDFPLGGPGNCEPCNVFGNNNKVLICEPAQSSQIILRANATQGNCPWDDDGVRLIIAN